MKRRITPKLRAVGVLAASIAVLAGCGASEESADGTTKVRVITGGGPISDSQFSIGEEMGYNDAEGLDVEVAIADGSSQAMQLLVAGQADVAVASLEAFLSTADAGHDVVGVSLAYGAGDGFMFGIMVPEDSPYQAVGDLPKGSVVGVTGWAGGEVPVATAMLQDAGFDTTSEVELLPVGDEPASIFHAFQSGTIDAFGGSLTDFGALGAQGYEFRGIESPNSESFPIGAMIATTSEYAEANPAVIESIGRIWNKASYVWYEYPEAITVATKAAFPEAWAEDADTQYIIDVYRDIYQPAPPDAFGQIDIEGTVLYAELLQNVEPVEGGEVDISGAVDVSTVLTNDYIPAMNDWDRAEVLAAAKEYAASAA
ncbi:ABC transporter substrate-binding protein [Mycobacterium sp. NAZ190054]|uniref:ABC transporter substrate-binding protein n=1 Tax=Mycobacterium sp. NAZ190054 TaxID=1747766 RepID=UPI00079C1A19|nr:ABC transporter substrate-binding protein [Mycobacterium sp. NAZ190054]KWX67214.1 hypothetical protein ASJ79_22530 [Mycobacterium sp. NAZ190054]